MTLSGRAWRQPVHRYTSLSVHTVFLFLLLSNPVIKLQLTRVFSPSGLIHCTLSGTGVEPTLDRPKIDHHLALQDQDSYAVVRPSHRSPRGMRWRQGVG